MEFTKDTIAALVLPAGKSDHIEFDDNLPGFGIRLRAGGKRVWVAQYRARGRQPRVTLGDARKLSLAAARTAAVRLFEQVAVGGDPQGDKAEAKARAALRLGPLADRYLAAKKLTARQNTYIADHRYLTTYWKPLHSLAVEAVTRRMVAARLSELTTERGVTAAARARQSLSAFYSWLIGEGIAGENPVIGTNDPGIDLRARDRVLNDAELRSIWTACSENDFGKIVRLLTLTGARRDEIGGLCWGELDLEKGSLSIPGTRTKNHHPLHLPLAAAAVSILKSTLQREGRDLVFGGSGGPFSAWSYSTLTLGARIAEMNGGPIAAWRLHDIRRTVATGMAELGVQPHIVEAVLNHRSGTIRGVGAIYNRYSYEAEKRQALDRWADRILAVVEGRSTNVTPLRKSA